MLKILKYKQFRHLFSAQISSLLGTGLTTIALALLAYDLAKDNAGIVLGTALAIKMIAYVTISPIVGVYASHFPRRKFLVILDILRAGMVGLLPFVTEVWQIYILVFLFQSFSAAFTPTFQATIPDILKDEKEYTKALSLSRLAYDLENLISPALAAVLLGVMSFHWLFFGTVIGFLASALLVVSAGLPTSQKPSALEPFIKRLSKGFKIYLATPRLKGLLALNLAVASAGAMVIVNTVVIVHHNLIGNDQMVAIFFGAYGVGSMITALSLPKLLDRYRDRVMMLLGASLLTLWLLAAMAVSNMAEGLIVWFFLGIGNALILTPSGRLLVRSSHTEDRPALYAAHFSLTHACWLLTYPLAGWLGAYIGLENTLIVMIAITAFASILATRFWANIDTGEVSLMHTHDEQWHEHLHIHDEHHQHEHEGWEGPEPHAHKHHHHAISHSHTYVIDAHHLSWPK